LPTLVAQESTASVNLPNVSPSPTAGTAFGTAHRIRRSYACSDETIAQGVAKFAEFVAEPP